MYLSGIIRISDLSRFFSLSMIRELELHDESNEFYLDGIDGDDGDDFNKSAAGGCQYTCPSLIPSYFDSMLILSDNSMLQTSRPATYGLVSPDDEIIHSSGRVTNVGHSSWPSTKADSTLNCPTNLSSPCPSLSSSMSSSEDGEESQSDSSSEQDQSDLDSVSSVSDEVSDSPIDKKLFVRSRRITLKVPKLLWPHGFCRLRRRRRRSVNVI